MNPTSRHIRYIIALGLLCAGCTGIGNPEGTVTPPPAETRIPNQITVDWAPVRTTAEGSQFQNTITDHSLGTEVEH